MSISKQAIEELFIRGEVVTSGGGRSEFCISEILDNRIRIQPTKSPTASRLRYDKLSVVIDSFAEINPTQIEKSVGALLARHGLRDTQNESYLYGFAREYRDRKTQGALHAYHRRLSREIQESELLTQSEREQRLISAPRIPEKIVASTTVFKRNADVIAEVLYRANGICGECKEKAPFNRRSNGTPYLEVHHLKPLADDGEDTVANAIALCPNCHRRAHYA